MQGQGVTSSLIDFTVRKDCVRTRQRREPIAHWTKASSRRCLVIHSRPQKFTDSRIRKQADLLSNYAGRYRRLLPKRTHSKDVCDRLVADVFVDGRSVEEMLRADGYAKNWGPPMANGQPGDSAR
jgi:hypothetical protein